MLVAGIAWGAYSLRGKGAGDPLRATAGNFLRAVPFALALSLAMLPWARAGGSSLVHPPPIPSSLDRRFGQVEMSDSQKIAPYVALKLLGYDVNERTVGVTVLQVEKGAPAAKALQPE